MLGELMSRGRVFGGGRLREVLVPLRIGRWYHLASPDFQILDSNLLDSDMQDPELQQAVSSIQEIRQNMHQIRFQDSKDECKEVRKGEELRDE